jgi:photosystem II stability/assembly factor-like uncharacterized protein
VSHPKGKKAVSSARGRKRRSWLIGLPIIGVVILGGGWWLASSPGQAQPKRVTQFTHIHGLDAPAWADGDVFVSTHFGLVRITGEGEWLEVGTAKHDFMGFTAHPTEAGVLYSSGHPEPGSALPNPIGFMVSRDAGESWQPLSLTGRADFHALAVQETNGDVLYGFNGVGEPGLYRSLDGGREWEKRPGDALTALGGPYGLAVHPDDPDVLLAGTRAGLLSSHDGGENWELLALEGVAVTAVAFAPGDGQRVWAYGASPEVGLVLSDDGGDTWTSVGLVLENNDAVGYIAPTPDALYLGSFGQTLYRSVDGGGSWQQLARSGVPQSE